MLVLTRRIGAALNIGDGVQVIVLGIKGNQVRIGITAPKTISVHREKIYERIKNERELNWAPNNARRKQPLIVNVGARRS